MTSGDSPNERSPLLSAASSEYLRRTRRTQGIAAAAEADTPNPLRDQRHQVESSNMQLSSSPSSFAQVRNSVRQEADVKKNISFRYEHYEYFVYSQCLPAWLLLLLRLAMGGICVGVFLYLSIMSPFVNFVPSNSTSDDDNKTDPTPTFKRHFYLCYLTIWSYLIITLYFITTLVNTITMSSCCQRSSAFGDFSLTSSGFKSTENLLNVSDPSSIAGASRQFGLRLQWLLFGVAANAALIVTFAYFAVLYPMIKRVNPGPISGVDLLVHGFNSVFMLLEVACSGMPVRLVHAVYTGLYGLLYGLFSLLYWIPDHSNVIYPVLLDWNHAGLTIGMMCLILFVGLPIIQLIWWLVYLARCFVATGLLSRSGGWRTDEGLSV